MRTPMINFFFQLFQSILSLGVDDAELAAIVDRGLDKRPDRRWPGMAELGVARAAR